MKKLILILCLSVGFSSVSNGQILISLLLGDKLNSDKLEFGLIGGVSLSDMSNVEEAKMLPQLHLGFYFDFLMKNNFSFTPAVLVVNTMGVQSLPTYAIGNEEIDAAFEGGNITRELSYFQVPLMMKYKMKNRISFAAGPQVALLHDAVDEFNQTINNKNDAVYTHVVKDEYTKLDAGVIGGVAYSFKEGKAMSTGVKYYQGLVDVTKNDDVDVKNSAWFFYVTIPIGVSKKEK
ncbi:MAG: PorT family protein [Reichenbachiella sp.]